MGVDVFGRRTEKPEATRGPPGIGYKLTEDEQFDVENKRICNLAAAVDKGDAVNLKTLQQAIKEQHKTFLEFQTKTTASFTAFKSQVEELLIQYTKNQKRKFKDG